MIKYITPISLRQKIILYVLVPTILILLGSGYVTFNIAKDLLIETWTDNTNANLKNGASIIDHQLRRPKAFLDLIQDTPPGMSGHSARTYLIKKLRAFPIVTGVIEDYPIKSTITNHNDSLSSSALESGFSYAHFKTTPAKYTVDQKTNKISLISNFLDDEGNIIGKIEAIISLPSLVTELTQMPWWKIAVLLDENGNRINAVDMPRNDEYPKKMPDKIWAEIQKEKYGTLFSPEQPPKKVCLFYHLNIAPWTLIVDGDGEELVKPLMRFRAIFFLITGFTTLIILLTIHLVTSRINKEISQVSSAARRLTNGEWGKPLAVGNHDEIGILKDNFNQMTLQLQEGIQLQKSMEIAREVQQNLLPSSNFQANDLDIAASCIYYDETGGDYFDIVNCSENQHASLAVGDVVGHGIGAALLMATTRSLLRGKLDCGKNLAQTASEVNSLLCEDTQKVANFVTLFLMRVDYINKEIEWLRAGHEPAIAYYPRSKKFSNLTGKGLALGVDNSFRYVSNKLLIPTEPIIILIGTDGIWDAENDIGEQFGKDRSKDVIATNAHLPAETIMKSLRQAIETFIGETKQTDDITLMIIKLS